jgi:hypothetical protein
VTVDSFESGRGTYPWGGTTESRDPKAKTEADRDDAAKLTGVFSSTVKPLKPALALAIHHTVAAMKTPSVRTLLEMDLAVFMMIDRG